MKKQHPLQSFFHRRSSIIYFRLTTGTENTPAFLKFIDILLFPFLYNCDSYQLTTSNTAFLPGQVTDAPYHSALPA